LIEQSVDEGALTGPSFICTTFPRRNVAVCESTDIWVLSDVDSATNATSGDGVVKSLATKKRMSRVPS
jgi:hypothetical protein